MTQDHRHLVQFYKVQKRDFEALSKNVFESPTPAAVHRLRVTTRRLRAVLWLLRKSSDELRFKKLGRDLRALGQSLGAVRELDVAIRNARIFELDPTSLKPKRKKNQKNVHPLLAPEHRARRSKRLRKVARLLATSRALTLDTASSELQKRLSTLKAERLDGPKTLHRFRIAVKKTRYTLEARGTPVAPLEGLQDCLGRARDLETLEGLLGANRRVRRERTTLNARARRLAQPALRATLRTIAQK